jgi:hypothetical protein
LRLVAAGKGAFADPQGVYLQVAIVVGMLEGIQHKCATMALSRRRS